MVTNDSGENPTNWTVSGTADAAATPKMRVTRRIGGIAATIPDGSSDSCGQLTLLITQSFSYTILNIGSAPLNIVRSYNGSPSGMSVPQSPGTFPSSLTPGSSTVWSIPITASASLWQITPAIACNDPSVIGPNYDWTMSGTAGLTGAEIGVQRNGVDIVMASVDTVSGGTAGSAATVTYRIRNDGIGANLVSTVAYSNAANCSTASAPSIPSITSGSTNDLAVQITPSSNAAWSVDVTITSNDSSDGQFTWRIAGTASGGGAGGNGNGSAATGGGGCGAGSAGAFLLIALCGVGLRRRR